jgi:hypothetical protein
MSEPSSTTRGQANPPQASRKGSIAVMAVVVALVGFAAGFVAGRSTASTESTLATNDQVSTNPPLSPLPGSPSSVMESTPASWNRNP